MGLRERQIFLLRLLDEGELLEQFSQCKNYDSRFGLSEEDFSLLSVLPFEHLKSKSQALRQKSPDWSIGKAYKTIEEYRTLANEGADKEKVSNF